MEQETLLSLFRSKELEEQEIVTDLLKVDAVLAQRQSHLAEIKANRQDLQSRIKNARRDLLRSNGGIPGLISQIDGWKVEIEQIGPKLEAAEAELARARERSELIQGKLAATRLEKARIEKLIDKSNLAKLIKHSAIDEMQVEESATGHRSKGEWN